ncbi:DUF5793 family protein [Halolamina litorea]|uniref:DUF5793 family protein n=1 Tax=Halolamina litorea TaxID=1515593 RepID=A0ABD6BRL9_9EURY|nr:DUF5793 family protein [Halolamina litorea]
MRRDYFELDVTNVDWAEAGGAPAQPLVEIEFSGPEEMLRERLSDADGDLLAGEDVDVAFRLQEPLAGEGPAPGVVSVTNRVTGEYVLELNETADDVLRFIDAAREFGENDEDGGYRAVLSVDGEELVSYEKGTFLVYDADGEFLREESLIPPGVEL